MVLIVELRGKLHEYDETRILKIDHSDRLPCMTGVHAGEFILARNIANHAPCANMVIMIT